MVRHTVAVARLREIILFLARSSKRMVVVVVGAALLAVGAVMMVTPGPGLLAIIAGLAVLATEFAWAARLLDKAKDKAAQAKDAVRAKRRPAP